MFLISTWSLADQNPKINEASSESDWVIRCYPNKLGGPAYLARFVINSVAHLIDVTNAEKHASALRDLWTDVNIENIHVPTMDKIKWEQPFRYHPGEHINWMLADAASLLATVFEQYPKLELFVHNLDEFDKNSISYMKYVFREGVPRVCCTTNSIKSAQPFLKGLELQEYVVNKVEGVNELNVQKFSKEARVTSRHWQNEHPLRISNARSAVDKKQLLLELNSAARSYTIGGYYESAKNCIAEGKPLASELQRKDILFDLLDKQFLLSFASRNTLSAHEAVTEIADHNLTSSDPKKQATANYYHAMYLLRMKKPSQPEQAAKLLKNALSLMCNTNENYLLLAFLHNSMGLANHQLENNSEALSNCATAIKILKPYLGNPRVRIECATFQYNIAQIHFVVGDISAALICLDKTLEVEGDLAFYYAEKARFLLEIENYIEAERNLLFAHKIGIPTPESLSNLALAQLAIKKMDDALATLKTLRIRFPEIEEGFVNAVHILLLRDQLNSVKEIARSGLHWHQLHPGLLGQMGMAEHKSRNFQEALRFYEEALKIKPADIGTLVNKAALYFDMGEFSESRKALEHANMIQPNNSVIEENLKLLKTQYEVTQCFQS